MKKLLKLLALVATMLVVIPSCKKNEPANYLDKKTFISEKEEAREREIDEIVFTNPTFKVTSTSLWKEDTGKTIGHTQRVLEGSYTYDQAKKTLSLNISSAIQYDLIKKTQAPIQVKTPSATLMVDEATGTLTLIEDQGKKATPTVFKLKK